MAKKKPLPPDPVFELGLRKFRMISALVTVAELYSKAIANAESQEELDELGEMLRGKLSEVK